VTKNAQGPDTMALIQDAPAVSAQTWLVRPKTAANPLLSRQSIPGTTLKRRPPNRQRGPSTSLPELYHGPFLDSGGSPKSDT